MNQISQILGEVKKAVVGKDRVLVWVMTVILARGHILLEDIPGVGKTTMALAFAKALGLEYGRVQFTPDVLPSDITGYSIYNKETGAMRYQPGAIVCNIFLADELNRATSRTQSALLEAMEEGQVTVDGVSHRIPQPFIVFATQNPTGASGTQLLPDSQMDRFTVRMSIGYPEPEDERNMVLRRQGGNPLALIRPVVTREQLAAMLYRYAALKGRDLTAGENLNFTDASDVSAYALPALQWATGEKILTGSNGALNPQATATRAHLAAILHRYFG